MEQTLATKQKLPKLTKQDKVFVSKVVETGNLTKSVQKGYGIEDPNYAAVKGQRLIRKDNIIDAIQIEQETLKSALKTEGVTPTKIAKTINGLLDANDYNAQDKGLKYATNIYGVEDLTDKPKNNTTYNFIFNAETQKEIGIIEAKIKERLINATTPEKSV